MYVDMCQSSSDVSIPRVQVEICLTEQIGNGTFVASLPFCFNPIWGFRRLTPGLGLDQAHDTGLCSPSQSLLRTAVSAGQGTGCRVIRVVLEIYDAAY